MAEFQVIDFVNVRSAIDNLEFDGVSLRYYEHRSVAKTPAVEALINAGYLLDVQDEIVSSLSPVLDDNIDHEVA